jgi:Uma2 family endonuclease
MALSVQQQDSHFTYADYLGWPETGRWELFDGIAYAMAAPQRIHQEIVFELGRQVGNYLQGKPCRGYVAPFDVRLPKANEADDKVDTVVQPDLSIICERSKLDDKGCRGAPDWIIEVLSPATAFNDMSVKLDLYQKHGVKEYWIVHPADRWIMVYILQADGQYAKPAIFNMERPTAVSLFPELSLDWTFMADVA